MKTLGVFTITVTVMAMPVFAGGNEGKVIYHSHHHGSGTAKGSATDEYRRADKKMHDAMSIVYTGDPDLDFALAMVPHHQGAVDMAEVELKYGTDPQMRQLAEWIILTQSDEIGTLQSWISRHQSNWRAANADQLESVRAYKAADEKMHHAMMVDYTGDPDVDFARHMIPHHQGAIDMTAVLKKHGKYQSMRKLGDSIISTQTAEINAMKGWLAKHPIPLNPTKKSKKKTTHEHHASH